MVKHLPAMWKTQVRSLGWEDALEKEMATYSGTLAWQIPWTEEPGRLQSMWLQRVGHFHFFLSLPKCIPHSFLSGKDIISSKTRISNRVIN